MKSASYIVKLKNDMVIVRGSYYKNIIYHALKTQTKNKKRISPTVPLYENLHDNNEFIDSFNKTLHYK